MTRQAFKPSLPASPMIYWRSSRRSSAPGPLDRSSTAPPQRLLGIQADQFTQPTSLSGTLLPDSLQRNVYGTSSRLTRLPGSFRLNAGFPNDHAVFLMFPDNQFAKLFAVAKSTYKPSADMDILDLGKLGGLTDGLTHARDDFRGHAAAKESKCQTWSTSAPSDLAGRPLEKS
jgi:hypothetical protein